MTTKEPKSRKDLIFEIIVRSYVDTAEPVGSRTISQCQGIKLSPASIRNVMADLEDEGLIHQPHTSAGRVPTDKGYRYFVDHLMRPEVLSDDERRWIEGQIIEVRSIDGLVQKVSKVISRLTGNASLVYIKRLKKASILSQMLEELEEQHKALSLMQLFEEEPELIVEGLFRIFDQPEFHDSAKMRLLLREFDHKDHFLEIIDRNEDDDSGVRVHIGHENEVDRLEDVSLVIKDCCFGDTPIGSIAVVGPTRMRYPKAVSVVDFVADTVSEKMKRF